MRKQAVSRTFLVIITAHPPLAAGKIISTEIWLETQFESELDLPRIVGAEDLPEARRAELAVWQIEVDVVEQVEEFRAELNAQPLVDRSDLGHSQVHAFITRAIDDAPACVPEGPERVELEGVHVEPLVRRPGARVGIGDYIGPIG